MATKRGAAGRGRKDGREGPGNAEVGACPTDRVLPHAADTGSNPAIDHFAVESGGEEDGEGESLKPSSTVYVKNLNFSTTEDALRNLFEGFGSLRFDPCGLRWHPNLAMPVPCQARDGVGADR
jgi:hypothetical protein